MTSPGMPDVRQYQHRYMYGTFVYARPCWGLPLLLTALCIISVTCSECISRFFVRYMCFWSIPSRFFHPQNICALEQEQNLASSYAVHLFRESKSTRYTQASSKCVSQMCLVVSFGISFIDVVPGACTRFHHSPSVPSPLKHFVHFHSCN
jgi:hypothetical protein